LLIVLSRSPGGVDHMWIRTPSSLPI